MKKRVLILGAAGRDFHNFNTIYKNNLDVLVTSFTATQIPFIEKRIYPPELAGPLYPKGIPIHPEEHLADLLRSEKVDEAVFSYSDVSHEHVMHRASICAANNVDFVLLGAERTMLESTRPVISVSAVRTGCGKSGVTRYIAGVVREYGKKPVVIRHPMPYGTLSEARKVQRFEKEEDLKAAECTIEEMEEYEPLIEDGITVYSGIDFREILTEAEKEGELIIWDGGNNDLPFIKPDLELVVADPLRAGHELLYYPGEVNFRRAHCIIINKANSATAEAMETVRTNARTVNPGAKILITASQVSVSGPIEGKKVLVIEDGPTLTHGGMDLGAGIIAATANKAIPVNVRPYAVGTIKTTLAKYPKLKNLLPAMGYSKAQIKELEDTINRTPCDCVLMATPVDLSKVIEIKRQVVRVRYEIRDIERPGFKEVITAFLREIE